jgi:hypothetical protein
MSDFRFLQPDYQDAGIASLMSSLRAGMGDDGSPYAPSSALCEDDIKRAQHVVLWVVDGLGYDFLQRRPESFLAQHCSAKLTSVFPTTTSAAVTTFLSGVPPQQHGLTGWFMYLRELGAVSAILPFTARAGGAPYQAQGIDIRDIVNVPSFYPQLDRRVNVLTENWLVGSAFSSAYQGGARMVGHTSLDDCANKLVQLTASAQEKSFTYAYWSKLDHLCHSHGVDSEESNQHFAEIDATIAKLYQSLQGTDTLLLVCADHGLTDTAEDKTIHLDDHPQLRDMLALPLCGEPRAAYCYLRAGCEKAFYDYVSSHLSEQCEAYASEDLLQRGLFGEGVAHEELANRIGDVTLIMKDNFIIKDRLLGEHPFSQVGVHGGLSSAELYVPLIKLDC